MAEQNKPGTGNSRKPPKGPVTKEDAIRQLVERDPQRAAALLREILKKKP